MTKYPIIFLLVILLTPFFSYAHSGDTDIYGFHTCWLGYYECAQQGEQYGVRHYHGPNYSSSVPVYSKEQLEDLAKKDKTYKNIKNGYQAYEMTFCDEGYSEDEGECVKPKAKVLRVDNSSMSDPANNPRIRFVNSLKTGRYANIEDLTDKELELYSGEIVDLVPTEKIKEYTPNWFVKKYLPQAQVAGIDSDREALLKQIQDLLALIVMLQTQMNNQH